MHTCKANRSLPPKAPVPNLCRDDRSAHVRGGSNSRLLQQYFPKIRSVGVRRSFETWVIFGLVVVVEDDVDCVCGWWMFRC